MRTVSWQTENPWTASLDYLDETMIQRIESQVSQSRKRTRPCCGWTCAPLARRPQWHRRIDAVDVLPVDCPK